MDNLVFLTGVVFGVILYGLVHALIWVRSLHDD